jgi:cell division protein FtsA
VVEEVKSPMYATSVGLVLAGFKDLDDRDELYKKRLANSGPSIKKKEHRELIPKDIFSSIKEKLKGIISDDIEDENY